MPLSAGRLGGGLLELDVCLDLAFLALSVPFLCLVLQFKTSCHIPSSHKPS